MMKRRRFLKGGLALLATTLVEGCAGQFDVRGIKSYYEGDPFQTPQEILRKYFTEEAYCLLKEIPVLNNTGLWGPGRGGVATSGSASDDRFNAFHHGLFNTGRFIAVDQAMSDNNPAFGLDTVVHEYLHQSAFEKLIDMKEATSRYQELVQKGKEYPDVIEIERKLAQDYPEYIRDSEAVSDHERIANLGVRVAFRPYAFSTEVHQAYKRTLRASEKVCNKLSCPKT